MSPDGYTNKAATFLRTRVPLYVSIPVLIGVFLVTIVFVSARYVARHTEEFAANHLNVEPLDTVIDPGGIDRHGDDKYTLTLNHVYYNDFFGGTHVIPQADVHTFVTLFKMEIACGLPAYGRDASDIFVDDKILEGADVDTFAVLEMPYAKDKNHVYDKDKVIEDVDPSTFRVLHTNNPGPTKTCGGLEWSYALDKNHVVHTDGLNAASVVQGIDPQTFAIINNSYARDKQGVYVLPSFTKITEADPATFEVTRVPVLARDAAHVYVSVYAKYQLLPISPRDLILVGNSIAKDFQNVYFIGESVKKVEGADASTFTLLAGVTDGIYKDKNKVYYEGGDEGDSWITPVEGSDPESFVRIEPYAKDNLHVYVGATAVAGADPGTFHIISKNDGIWADKDHLYFSTSAVPTIDPATARVGEAYIVDADSVVYFMRMWDRRSTTNFEVLDALPKSFTELPLGYALDSHNAFFEGKRIASADPVSFRVLGGDEEKAYATDAGHLYHNGEILNVESDFRTLTLLNVYYAKDTHHVFSIGDAKWLVINGADPKTFKIIPSPSEEKDPEKHSAYAEDTGHVYFFGATLSTNPETFEILKSSYGDNYAKDPMHVWYWGKEIAADPASFRASPTNGLEGQDRNYVYFEGRRERLTNAQIQALNP